jgi:hypothetical protein
MMSFLTYITGFFMNFELLPTDRLCKLEKRGNEIKKIFFSETTEPIPTKNWISSFREEDFFKISSPLFSNLHNRSKLAKFKVHKKSLILC